MKYAVWAIAALLCWSPAEAGAQTPDPIPRILLVGDSWGALMQAFDTYKTVLPEYPGLGQYRSIGFRTTQVGVRAAEYDTPEVLAIVADELNRYPAIDVVHLSLGGNDILYGDWRPGMSPAQAQALFDTVTGHIANVIDYILALRPDIRIGLCGYTFGNHSIPDATTRQVNEAILGLELTKLAMVQGKSRVFYVNNLGLMQYYYGIPDAEPPIPAGSVPRPGGYPDYTPMPGGNIGYPAPLDALVDDDIHLTADGYAHLARRCIDEFFGAWLSWPRALEIAPLDSGGIEQRFRVRFTEAVTGVDLTDFSAAAEPAKSAAPSAVSGSGPEYTVTVTVSGETGTARLSVLDDDSIVDDEGNPLGGPGAGNGGFTVNVPFAYEDPPVPADDDFDVFFEHLDVVTAPYQELLAGFSFKPELCDANGGFHGVDPLQIDGNGLLDSYEFALIRECLRNSGIDLSAWGGVTHAVVASAWQNNLARMREDLGGEDGLALSVFQGLDSILAAYTTLGDPISAALPVMLIMAALSYNDFPLDLYVPNQAEYVLLPQYFSLDGDADGDGYTNAEEYGFFVPIGGRDLYVLAALQPGMTPDFACDNSEGGTFEEGDSFCLIVPEPAALGSGFQWYKDGQPLLDGGFISGCRWRALHILSLRQSDSGLYSCEYDDGVKTHRVFGPVRVTVAKVTPVLHLPGIVVLASLVALLFALRARRRLRY
ncbi:MAG: hypothetical protein KA184_05070 [Candidatus Hydrogenedentes bacterium]|nr:hypothetical protein [Candidatus Hydrogenedentota bacterium]